MARGVVVQLVVRWRGDAVYARVLAPARTFVVGSASDADLVLPEAWVPRARHLLVAAGTQGDVCFFVPRGARVTAILAAPGARACAVFGDVAIELEAMSQRSIRRRNEPPRASWSAATIAILVHAGALLTSAFWMPRLDVDEDLFASTARSDGYVFHPGFEPVMSSGCGPDEQFPGGTGVVASGARGEAGAWDGEGPGALDLGVSAEESLAAPDPRARRPLRDRPRAAVSSADAGRDARAFAIDRRTQANERRATHGRLWGDSKERDARGRGALAHAGEGRGGGGDAEGIGLGALGKIGRGAGAGAMGARAFGDGSADWVPPRRAAPMLVLARAKAGDAARAVVRANLAGARLCYLDARRANPALAGTISVRFAIDGDGSTRDVSLAASDLPDEAVARCVVARLGGLAFPAERSSYELVFSVVFRADG